MDTFYHFRLSPNELCWLARAFGIAHLPLLENPLGNNTSYQLDEMLKTAPSTLQARGLIRKASGASWEIDRLPAAIVQWLGKVNSYVIISMHHCGQPSRWMYVFLAGEQGMTIALAGDSYDIILYPTMELLIQEFLSWVGITSSSTAQSSATFTISQPMELIQAVWNDSIVPTKALKSVGINKQSSKKTREWVNKLQWIGMAGVVSAKQQIGNTKTDLFLCGEGKTDWLGKGVRGDPDTIKFSPADTNQINRAVNELFNIVERLPPSPAAT